MLFLALIVTANVPVASFHDAVKKIDDPALAALGPRQVWNVFAPDPPGLVSSVAVRFVYRDGTRSIWRIKRGSALIEPYRDYRWLKLAENVPREQQAATGLLLWAVRTQAEDKPLARADLVRTIQDMAPIGKPRSRRGRRVSGVIVSLRAS